jgi:hypothetical protein
LCNGVYANAQELARSHRAGIWRGDFELPCNARAARALREASFGTFTACIFDLPAPWPAKSCMPVRTVRTRALQSSRRKSVAFSRPVRCRKIHGVSSKLRDGL